MNLAKFNADIRKAAELIINKRPVGVKLTKSLGQAFKRAGVLEAAPEVFHKYVEDHEQSEYGFTGDRHTAQFTTIESMYSALGDKAWREIQDRFSVLMQHAELYSGTDNAFDSFPVAMRAMLLVSEKLRAKVSMTNYSGVVYFSPQDSEQYQAYSGLELIHGANHLKHDAEANKRVEYALAGQAGADKYDAASWPTFSYDDIEFRMGVWDNYSQTYLLPNAQETNIVHAAAIMLSENPASLFG